MGSPVAVEKVTGRKRINEFIRLPWKLKIYENDPCWIPPLISSQKKLFNPRKGYFFDIGEAALFIACRDGKPVGRISAQVNRLYEERYDRQTGFFGFYESINDLEVARALYGAAENWLKQQGKRIINGPQSFSIYDSVGFEVEGIDETPGLGLQHFAGYYRDLAEGCGFRKCIDWYCYLVEKIADYEPYLKEVRENYLKSQEVDYRILRKGELKEKAEEIRRVFNLAWEGNWGHLPLTEKQFASFLKELKGLVIPELVYLAEKNGRLAGFIISLPDVNPHLRILNGRLYPWRLFAFFRAARKTKRLRTIIMGVLPEFRGKKIDDVFYLHTIEKGVELGFTASDCSLIVETNRKIIGALEPLKARRYKTYRIYEKEIP